MPIDYGKTFSDEQAWFRETNATKEGFIQVGRAIEGTRGSLQRLTAQVKAADEIFTKTARRGEILGVRALAEYTLAHNKVNEVFSKSTSSWTHGFAAVQDHAQGATSHLRTFLGELSHFHHTRTEISTDFSKALERQSNLQSRINAIQAAGVREVSQSLALRKSEADRMVVIGNWEMRMLEFRRAAVPLMVMWGSTVGRVLEQSFELQRSFRDINLDFARSVDFTKTLLTAVGSSGGLVTMKEAAEAARTLRSYSLDFLKPEIIERVSLFHELTGVSSESIAKILYQLKSIGGSMPNINNLTNSFTYFARETDLGASGVADLLGKMDPLLTSVPREMRENLITQVLALGDAFKKAGLNADEMIKTIQEMQDMTSSEGRKKAGLIASATGTSPLDLMMGNMDPAKIGYLWTQTQRQYMQRLTQGGRLNPQTAATILARRFGGSIEEWKIAGGKTDTQMSAMQAQMQADEENANRVSNFSKALGEMTSGPIAKLSAILATLNRVTLETGTNIIQGINKGFADLNKTFPGVHKTLSSFFHYMTDEKRDGFRWAVATATKTIMILTPLFGIALVKSVWGVIKAGGLMITTFRKMAETIDKVAVAAELYTVTQSGGAKILAKEEAEIVGKAAGGGFFKKLLGMIGLGGLIGGGAVSVGTGAAEGGAKGIGGWIAKLFGKGAGKGGLEIAEKGGVKLLEKEGAKIGSKGLSDMIPGLGLIVSMGWAIWDIFNILKDPKETTSGKTVKSLLKLIGGLLGGIPYIGWALSGAIDVWVASMDKNTDATQANTDAEKEKQKATGPVSIKSGGGTGAPPITGDLYSKPGVRSGPVADFKGNESDTGASTSGSSVAGAPKPFTGTWTQKNISWFKGPSGTAPSRYNNPSGMKEGPTARKFGGDSFGIAAGEHIVHFPTPEAGAAAQFALLASSGYVGRKLKDIVAKWTDVGHGHAGGSWDDYRGIMSAFAKAGFGPDEVITREMLASPRGIKFAKVQASAEEGFALSKMPAGGWEKAQSWAFGGPEPKTGTTSSTSNPASPAVPTPTPVTPSTSSSSPPGNAVLSNSEIQRHFDKLIRARKGRIPLLLRQDGESATAQINPSLDSPEMTVADRHGKAMIAELQASNRMNKERLHYLRQQRFLGPTLLPAAADDTLANV